MLSSEKERKLYTSYYCDFFESENKWYYKILKKDVNDFLQLYEVFKKAMDEEQKTSAISQQLEKYCKPSKPPINHKLRNGLRLNQSDYQLIEDLDDLINKFSTSEEMIVYRGSDIDIFENDSVYTDAGYLSTSLVKESVQFAHNEKYLYKILIPKETHGFCPQVFVCRDIECEFILQRNAKLQLLKRRKRKEHIEITCKLERCRVQKYRCIKEFYVSKCDEDDCPTDEYLTIHKGSVYEYTDGYVGESDIRMYLEDGDDDCGYLDITFKTLEECFERIA